MGNVLKRYHGTSWEAVGGTITGDTLPIGSIVEFDGTDIPAGWEEVSGTNKIKKVSQVAGLVGGVSNTYSESANDAYSCDYINGTVLYEDSAGSNTEITLSDNPFNYSRIKVFAGWKAGEGFPYGIDSYEIDLSCPTSRINISYFLAGSGWIIGVHTIWELTSNPNKLTPYVKWKGSILPTPSSVSADTNTYICKVIGYK